MQLAYLLAFSTSSMIQPMKEATLAYTPGYSFLAQPFPKLTIPARANRLPTRVGGKYEQSRGLKWADASCYHVKWNSSTSNAIRIRDPDPVPTQCRGVARRRARPSPLRRRPGRPPQAPRRIGSRGRSGRRSSRTRGTWASSSPAPGSVFVQRCRRILLGKTFPILNNSTNWDFGG